MNDYEGYVLYSHLEKYPKPIGIVSPNFKRKAFTNNIPKSLKDALVQIEDKRFFQHYGIDYRGILRALVENYKAKKVVQGGSTITQQLCRNLLYHNKRTFSAKITETFKALYLEHKYTKDDILNLYFNNIYFGNNLYGIRSASLYYFEKEPYSLRYSEQLVLLTLLRGPNFYIKNIKSTQDRFIKLNKLLFDRKTISVNRHSKNVRYKIELKNNFLNVFSSQCIPFITNEIDDLKKIIFTTLNSNLQKQISEWVINSKYPITIICIHKGNVIASSSSYGSNHAFTYKTNVGSTLKPFIYTFLRDNGVGLNQKVSTLNENNIGWHVREVVKVGASMTLAEALLQSNNNVFINSCFSIGIEKAFTYLSFLFNKSQEEFHLLVF